MVADAQTAHHHLLVSRFVPPVAVDSEPGQPEVLVLETLSPPFSPFAGLLSLNHIPKQIFATATNANHLKATASYSV